MSGRRRRGGAQLRKQLIQAFRMRGLQLSVAAVGVVEAAVADVDDPREAVRFLASSVNKENLTSTTLDRDAIETVIREVTGGDEEGAVVELEVLSAFDAPRFSYDAVKRRFYSKPQPESLFGTPDDKADVFRQRYLMLKQRVQRDPLFTPPLLDTGRHREYYELTPVDSLLGTTGVHYIFGMITQPKEGIYHIEDLNGSVQISLDNAEQTPGMFTENCFVLAEGIMDDEIFFIKYLGFPPPESRAASQAALGAGVDLFGGAPPPHKVQETIRLESECEGMIVVISDLWIDDPVVLEQFDVLLQGFADIVPTAFVLVGNFFSAPVPAAKARKAYTAGFDALSERIQAFPALARESQWIFVPGFRDPGNGDVLPRLPLPNVFTRKLRQRLPKAVFTSNPTRLRYGTQEIMLLREDLISVMRRNCILTPIADDGADGEEFLDLYKHLAKTVCDQSHVVSLPMHVRPIYWPHAQALNVYPLPDAIILADAHDQYDIEYEGCRCVNPGPFPVDYSFLVYMPHLSEDRVQMSKVKRASVTDLYGPDAASQASGGRDQRGAGDDDDGADDDDDEDEEVASPAKKKSSQPGIMQFVTRLPTPPPQADIDPAAPSGSGSRSDPGSEDDVLDMDADDGGSGVGTQSVAMPLTSTDGGSPAKGKGRATPDVDMPDAGSDSESSSGAVVGVRRGGRRRRNRRVVSDDEAEGSDEAEDETEASPNAKANRWASSEASREGSVDVVDMVFQ